MKRQETIHKEREAAQLVLDIKTRNPKVEMLVSATEQGIQARQHRLLFKGAEQCKIQLPAGSYFLQVVARQHEPVSTAVDLKPGSNKHSVALRAREDVKVPSFEERLKYYGLSLKQVGENIELKEGEYRQVKAGKGQRGVVQLKAETLDDVKRFIGAPYGVYDHDRSRFDPIEVSKETISRLRNKEELSDSDRLTLQNVVGEYLHGNETAYADLIADVGPILSEFVTANFAAFLYTQITIPAGATYEFGPGTLVVDRLRIHTTGNLVPVGQCKFDIGTWEEFS